MRSLSDFFIALNTSNHNKRKKEKAVSVQRWRVALARPLRFVLHLLKLEKAPQAHARPERLVLHRHKLEKAPQAYKTVSTNEICEMTRARSFTPQELNSLAYEPANKQVN